MSADDLAQQVDIDLASMRKTRAELLALFADVQHRDPTTREAAAAGLFLANLYTGAENVLKRIASHHSAELPSGDRWHVELFEAFCDPRREDVPTLFDQQLAGEMAPYRRFRHVVHRGYAFQLRWADMLPGVQQADGVFARFEERVREYIDSLRSGR